jgi:hypothetical protein
MRSFHTNKGTAVLDLLVESWSMPIDGSGLLISFLHKIKKTKQVKWEGKPARLTQSICLTQLAHSKINETLSRKKFSGHEHVLFLNQRGEAERSSRNNHTEALKEGGQPTRASNTEERG